MSYSKATSKGQMTIPIKYRKKYNLTEGAVVATKDVDEGLLLKPVPDIAESAGALASYADAKEVVADLVKARREDFR